MPLSVGNSPIFEVTWQCNTETQNFALEEMRALILGKEPRVIALECSAIPDIEYTALTKLAAGEEKLCEAGIELWLVGLNPVPLHTIQRSPLGATLGDERMFQGIGPAVEAYAQRFGQNDSPG